MNENNEEKKLVRCAIYTRVSTSEGLEQEFTSLDNQRESAESYIQSQKNLGWIVLPDRYNDGGFTGANTDRPALQKLISDIKEGKIDCCVVYKVDRLSRSLLDFTQLLEFFDKQHVTFVSVTQHFNTNTSMGRLTLNILLSFAQFEREIISERTRDKIGAAKRKGKWLGGMIPLGYNLDKKKHKLFINPEEAGIVREIFGLYLKHKSMLEVAKIINRKGCVTKIRKFENGKHRGGVKFSNFTVERILRNAYYAGKVQYQNILYSGEQESIIDEDTFKAVQEIMQSKAKPAHARKPSGKKIALLTELLRCSACNSSMYITHTLKRGTVQYQHYLCANAQKRGYEECPTRLVNAGLMEAKVLEYARKLSEDERLKPDNWEKFSLEEKRTCLMSILKIVTYHGKTEALDIFLQNKPTPVSFKVSKLELKHQPKSLKLISIRNEPQLRQNLLLAHQIQRLLDAKKAESPKQVAGWLNISRQRLNQIMNLLFLSPRIQEDILLMNSPALFAIPEYQLRPLTFEIDWEKQQEMWQKLLKIYSSDLSSSN